MSMTAKRTCLPRAVYPATPNQQDTENRRRPLRSVCAIVKRPLSSDETGLVIHLVRILHNQYSDSCQGNHDDDRPNKRSFHHGSYTRFVVCIVRSGIARQHQHLQAQQCPAPFALTRPNRQDRPLEGPGAISSSFPLPTTFLRSCLLQSCKRPNKQNREPSWTHGQSLPLASLPA